MHAYGFKIGNEYDSHLVDPIQIEKEFRQILKDANIADEALKSSFVFIVLDSNNMGNNMSKHMKDQVKQDLLIQKFDLKPNEKCLMLTGRDRLKLLDILGKLRLRLADLIDEKKLSSASSDKNVKLIRDPKVFEFLWIVDFPLFTWNEETKKFESTHHPFTAPINEHIQMVQEMRDLEKCVGLHYDLVLNGSEIGGGSIRIHNSQFQRHVLENVLGEQTDQLEHLLSALEYGAPPHGGIALGLDRIVALMCGTANIRNVIAFPKAQSGRDLMSSAPSKVNQEELDYYNIKCLAKEEK